MGPDENSYWNSLDGNGDGKVSMEEAMPQADDDDEYMKAVRLHEEVKFKAADKDGDSFLDVKEFGAYEWPEIDEAVETAYAQSILDKQDKDKDGKLTVEEWHHGDPEDLPHGEDFKGLDKNGDGKLDLEEM